MIGDPNRSQMMIVTNTENPSPINCADPHGKGLGTPMLGQRAKKPVAVSLLEQLPEEPAQSLRPDVTKDIPIRATVGPVTIGGKTFFKILGLVNDIPISRRAQSVAVAMIAP
jgi:hypothetical protein